jgi:cell division protein FtsB
MKEFRQSFYWVMGVAGAIVVFGTAWLVGRQDSNSADAKVLQVDAAQARATVQYLQTDIAEIKADIKTLLRKEKQ